MRQEPQLSRPTRTEVRPDNSGGRAMCIHPKIMDMQVLTRYRFLDNSSLPWRLRRFAPLQTICKAQYKQETPKERDPHESQDGF